MRGSWHGPARTCVRRGGHGRLAFDPFCPPSWPGTQCTSQQGVVQHCDPVPSMACSAVQGRGSSAEDASRHCLLCRQAGGGRECGGVRLVVRRSAGRQASVASVGRRTSSHVVGVLGWGAVDWSSDTNCLLVWEVLNKHLSLSDLASQVYCCYWVRIDPTNPHHHDCMKNHQLSSCICVLNSHCIL